MKKVLFLALGLMISTTMFADKKCCKDKKGSKKECCAKKAEAKVNEDGTTSVSGAKMASGEMHACCKKRISEGKAACCAQTSSTQSTTPSTATRPSTTK